jgi:hypothetical protein
MGATDNPIPDAQPAPAVEQRTCRVCKQTKVVSPTTWTYRAKGPGSPSKPHGMLCAICEHKRKIAHRERTREIAKLAAADETAKVSKAETKLDVARALKIGGKALNDIAPSVLARIMSWAEDEEHTEHRWANQFLAERVLPKKLYEEIGGEAAGVGRLTGDRPQYLVQVVVAQPEQAPGRVIEGQSEVVQVLPSPKPETEQ